MSKLETFVSVDVEATGPIPGPFSMLNLGAVAYNTQMATEISTFNVNLEEIEGAGWDPDTKIWWEKQDPQVLKDIRMNLVAPVEAMLQFSAWLKTLPTRPVMVAWPAGFDFTFVYYYLVRFTGKSPLSFACVDMKTMAMVLTGKPYTECVKSKLPKEWMANLPPKTHRGLDDARQQGVMMMRMVRDAQMMRIRAHESKGAPEL